MADRLPAPLTQKTTADMVAKLFTPIKYGECASFMVVPRSDIEYRLQQTFSDTKLCRYHLGKYFRKYVFVRLDAETVDTATATATLLLSIGEKKKREKKFPTAVFTDTVRTTVATGLEVVFLITHAQALLCEDNEGLFSALSALTQNHLRVQTLCFFETNIEDAPLSGKLPNRWVQNIHTFPLYQETDVDQFINHMCAVWHLTLTPKMKKEIMAMCGGHIWLVTEALRQLRNHPDLPLEEVWQVPSMRTKLEAVWHTFSPMSQTVFTDVVKHTAPSSERQTSTQYLINLGFVKQTGDQYQITIPLLHQYVAEIIQRKQLEAAGESVITFDGHDESGRFSPSERAALHYLLSARGTIVSREDLARVIWKEKWEEKFSDWALDKLMLRVRKRVASLGLPASMVQTKKGVGFTIPA